MKNKTLATAALFGLTLAAPADHIRRAGDIGHQVKSPLRGRQYGYPTGTAIYPTGTSAPYPITSGSASCPVDGTVVCGPTPEYFGLCNFGTVVWQRVSDGTACINGEVVGTGIYAVPTATGAYYPISTGAASCPVEGAVVCGPTPDYFGLCNFGRVIFQKVSDGTACINGEVVGTGIYAVPSVTGTY